MASIQRFIERKLRLKVNEKKSAVDQPWKRKFLRFSFMSYKEPKVRIAKESLKRMKRKVQEITSRKMSYSIEYRVEKLNQYLLGWCGYFALSDTETIFEKLDGWIRWRLRMCLWKNWKKPETKIRNLIRLGVPKQKAYEWGNSRKGY
jgi:RNA-directed DNA polymerase